MKKHLVRKLEVGITLLLSAYYLRPNVPAPVDKALALVGFLTVPLLIIGYWKRFIYVATRDPLLLLLTGTAVISVLWSTNPNSTLNYSRALLCSTAFGLYLAMRYSLQDQMRLIVWLFGIFTFLNLIVSLVMPSYGRSADYWIGITRYKNELSGTMAMAATLFLDMAVYGRKYRWAAFTGFGIALLLLVLSKGKGSLGMFGVMLFLFPLYRIAQQQYKTRVFLGISAALMLGVLTVAIFSNLEFIVVDILEKDMGGNGRDQVWTYLIQRALEKPWLGYGYGGFWTNPEEGLGVALAFPWIEGAGTGGGNAHSSYIDLFLQLGWLGVSLMSLSVLMVFVKIVLLLNITKKIEYFFMIQSLMILLVTSYSESYSGFISPRHLFWVLYVSNAFSTAIHLNRITKKVPSKLINSENTIEKYS